MPWLVSKFGPDVARKKFELIDEIGFVIPKFQSFSSKKERQKGKQNGSFYYWMDFDNDILSLKSADIFIINIIVCI